MIASVKKASAKRALILASLALLMAASASEAVSLQSSGTWSGAGPGEPTCLWTSGDLSVVRYGNPNSYGLCPGDHSSQSGFGFVGVTSTTITPGVEFKVGTFTHYNQPIYVGDRPFKYVTLNVKMILGTASPVTQTFCYQVTLDETTNS
ncbi:MAG: choice-of-anchor K domain-containing protein, partial [Methanothrix sp.]|nr:choice-of-anchor K domain-containing protein [Methanothrix sp.]